MVELTADVDPSDIIYLNVGGRQMSTTRETLTVVEDSLLATMFNGNWEQSVPRDRNGDIFIDQDPDLFQSMLRSLRKVKLLERRSVLHYDGFGGVVSNNGHPGQAFVEMCKYYGVIYVVLPIIVTLIDHRGKRSLPVNLFSPGIHLPRNGSPELVLDVSESHLYIKAVSLLILGTAKENNDVMVDVGLAYDSVAPYNCCVHGINNTRGLPQCVHIQSRAGGDGVRIQLYREAKVMGIEYGFHPNDR